MTASILASTGSSTADLTSVFMLGRYPKDSSPQKPIQMRAGRYAVGNHISMSHSPLWGSSGDLSDRGL